MTVTNDRIFGIHGDALLLRSKRMGVLASNIANADTPGYKAQDLSFNQALRAASGQGQGLQLKQDQSGQIASTGAAGGVKTMYRVPEQPSLDGNTVDMEQERVHFMKNAVSYQTTLSFLSGRIKSLNTALKGQ